MCDGTVKPELPEPARPAFRQEEISSATGKHIIFNGQEWVPATGIHPVSTISDVPEAGRISPMVVYVVHGDEIYPQGHYFWNGQRWLRLEGGGGYGGKSRATPGYAVAQPTFPPSRPQPEVEFCPAAALRRVFAKFTRELSAYLEYNQFTVNGATDQTVGDCLALLHSEVSEALDAYRKRGFVSWVREDGKPEGFGPELADVFIRLMDTAVRYDVDLAQEVRAKMNFNWTRPVRHGNPNL